MYKIVRMFHRPPTSSARRMQTIKTGLTLDEAQAHCQDPETSSSTATGAKARRVSTRCGCPWFDGYEET